MTTTELDVNTIRAFGPARATIAGTPLSRQELDDMEAYGKSLLLSDTRVASGSGHLESLTMR
jgi:hypothetical protein